MRHTRQDTRYFIVKCRRASLSFTSGAVQSFKHSEVINIGYI